MTKKYVIDKKVWIFHEIAPNFISSQKSWFLKYNWNCIDLLPLPYIFCGSGMLGIYFFKFESIKKWSTHHTDPSLLNNSVVSSDQYLTLEKNSLLGNWAILIQNGQLMLIKSLFRWCSATADHSLCLLYCHMLVFFSPPPPQVFWLMEMVNLNEQLT